MLTHECYLFPPSGAIFRIIKKQEDHRTTQISYASHQFS
ncbi:hypothetical protein MAXJ12_23332 [Mesorhizobium alhagi CCNWXJ12-2]|uniref:Uncharacterized protein n=1 Tax=Mesorhizobium alhagi CCNWXJ12-2 TaxID=1107882 RepID=H0HWW5_9HYPH|nr:hypothetical protein MAXJ12_23332 [Mesorhizobium alhagi CCNWXJ12-2]